MSHQIHRQRMSRRQFLEGGVALGLTAGLFTPVVQVLAQGNSKSQDAKDGSIISAAESTSSGPITVTDQLGKTVTFDRIPQRVATCIIPLPSIYFAVMGDTQTMVGCNPSSMVAYEKSMLKTMYPSLASVNTDWCARDFTVNVEELLKLKPDVVFQWTSQPEQIEKMESAGIKVIALKYGTVDDLKTWIHLLGNLFGKSQRAKELISYFDMQINEITDITADIPADERPVAVHLSGDLTVNGTGFTPYWIDCAGAVSPAAELGQQSVKVDMEQIYSWNPDYIFVGNFTDIVPSDLVENKLEGQDWSLVKAVRNNQVYKIPIGGYRWDPPCVETPLMIKWLASIMHPDLFKDMDMEAELRQFYQDIYDYELTDEDVSQVLEHRQD